MIRLHLAILHYMPVCGFAVYAILAGFENEFFQPILLSGWIVVVVYQTILTAVYSPPTHPSLAVALLLTPPTFLIVHAWYGQLDVAGIFIEFAAVDLLGVILGTNYAFIHKAVRGGLDSGGAYAVLFFLGITGTAGYFLVRLLHHFFQSQHYDGIILTVYTLAVLRSTLFFAGRLTALVARRRAQGVPPREFSAQEILTSVGLWLVAVPLLVWLRNLIFPS